MLSFIHKALVGACLATLCPLLTQAQSVKPTIPRVLSGLNYSETGQLVLTRNGQKLVDLDKKDAFSLTQMVGNPVGNETGILLDFSKPGLSGTVAYGPYNEKAEYPAVAFLPRTVPIQDGKALLDIKGAVKAVNDFFKLSETGQGVIGYRVLDNAGRIVYEGRVAFSGKGPYTALPTVIEGPFINALTSTGCIISYETQVPVKTTITVGNQTFSDPKETTHHEITVSGLRPAMDYVYTIAYANRSDQHHFQTAPASGSRKPFTFAFACANRGTSGGGERDFGGTNYQSSRAIMAAALLNGAVFMQATGDLTTGGNPSEDGHLMEYTNWKRAMEPFWHKIPVYTGMGDHEVNYLTFAPDPETKKNPKIDRFPYQTESGEATFARAFVHPTNGPSSEDGASYDPDSKQVDFPTYQENVYYYFYDNVGMIVLNTEYWKSHYPGVDGSPEGYIMDQQVKWLTETMQKLEKDPAIDHIFVSVHSAVFPNGDHANGAMWYEGNNDERPKVAGTPVKTGILERRDQLLDLCVNKSKKFLAFISGDEHNFAFLHVTPDTPMYPDRYTLPKLKLSRPFYHLNNGGGGSAPYAMLATPWMKQFQYFTEPPVLALISVNGQTVTLKAFNAETFGTVCRDVKLR
ncbi:purple acid phosphatase family protein [Spirosoma endbachense]|uniref:Calcineurin-like phosphoesterase domain-containing protein n=1 Tax=Spirosoma endbachense TaxID=2666025 RepID=A0A6P1VRX7_9BACT|nr:metallophosphoesterase family protein [Spirosoma endbachense]QHV95384.1 hypothetical protein GJR95_10345 [Spirosoma endbachense]